MLQLTDTIPFNTLHLLPKLVSAYLAAEPSVCFLTKYPFELSAFTQIIADKAANNTDRATLVKVLKKQYAAIPTTALVTANIELLAVKIIKGGGGVWGDIPMAPHPAISTDDAKEMVRYILSLKK